LDFHEYSVVLRFYVTLGVSESFRSWAD